MGETFAVTVDTSQLEMLKVAFKMFPKAIQKQIARFLGDEAWDFKKKAPGVLDSAYTIRDRNFVENKAFTVKRPKASEPINEQQAIAASLRIEGSGGLFTGWEEEIYGSPRALRKKSGGKYHRPIWENARKGLSHEGTVESRYRLRPGGPGFNSDFLPDAAEYNMPINQFFAMINKSSAAGQSKRAKRFKGKSYALGKNRMFVISKPKDGWTPGLFYFDENGKIRTLQSFESSPRSAEKFDWRGKTEAEVKNKFTPSYILGTYIVPALEKLWKK